ncbi:aminopeptidase N [Actinomadura gamaensis]|uniref:Aminopeptidase N n=1 Tax=Actinomadura gamaensis TaxID=1763541 RepID=A0ABV9TU84_9ACTN
MPSLTHAEARTRGALVDVHSYQVGLDLTGTGETFRSVTTVRFGAEPGAETFVDVAPETLLSATLNGRDLPVGSLDDGRLPLPGLAAGNELTVVADMAYSRQCEGLHRFTDPADGRVYVYSFVYLDHAPKVFACFDQPDLKAPYTFEVTCPEDWTVLGNTPAERTGPGTWTLGPSPAQATYLTALVAGPYAAFSHRHGEVELGFHCRESERAALAADVAEVFEITGQVLDACAEMFGIDYPFGKLDQVFVPEFSVLSLDHPGCVLLREQYLFSSAAAESERETRAVVLAHGISLMWLAGLVTNRWWDDLWLGQSLADYMAHRLTAEATRFPGPPTTFAARRKGQAYVPDQRPSTHPVCLEGPDVRTVQLELDRISYFKGHSVFRQLAAHIGDDRLRAALRTYFSRHGFGTASFADFVAALSDSVGSDMSGWADSWFRTCDVDTLTAELTVRDGRIAAAAIRQTAPERHPVLRTHTLDVGLYGDDGERTVHRVRVEGERTDLPELVGRPAPRLLLPNDGDLAYAKIRFDPASRAALPELLPELAPINRAMVWCALLLGVQDGVVPAAEHLGLVRRMVAGEPELSILAEVLEQARGDVADRFLPPAERPAAMAAVAGALRDRLAATAPGDERALTLFRALVDFSADTTELRGWLDGAAPPAGLAVDTDLAWRIRYRLAALGGVDEGEITKALADAPGADADQAAARCLAALPDPAAKDRAWTAITTDTELSNYRLWALGEGFWQPEQTELTAPYVERFFAEMPDAAGLRGDLVLDLLLRFFFPRLAADPATLELAERTLARPDLSPTLTRRIADYTDDLRRVVRARAAHTR